MGSNAEIRHRMEAYRGILLAINWIGSIIVIIAGFVLLNQMGGYAFFIIIIGVILGIIGHFLINVALAIPFILLNNGDILESMNKNQIIDVLKENNQKDTKKCPFCAENIKNEAKICPYCNKNIHDYENELKIKQEEERIRKEKEIKEKYKNFSDVISDEDAKKMSIEEKEKLSKEFRSKFEETSDDFEKKHFAKNLVALGYEYYRRYT